MISVEDQPTGLEIIDLETEKIWKCPLCEVGFIWDVD